VPFVGRIREIIEVIQLFEDFDPEELEGPWRATCAATARRWAPKSSAKATMAISCCCSSKAASRSSRRTCAACRRSWVTAGPGKTLGEMSLIDGEPRFASCVALEPVTFAVLDRESLSRILTEEPRIGVKLMMELLMLLNQRLRSVSAQLMDCMEARRSRIR
jgi:CRP/FNR family cyclic AMP-dependent transcriptional regulator